MTINQTAVKRRGAGALLAVALATTAACSGSATEVEKERVELVSDTPAATADVDSVRWALGSEPSTLDWVYSYDYPPNTVLSNVCESLMRINSEFEISPGLAESFEQVDDTTWVYQIRPEVHFHDGSVLTAEDVAFSLNRHLDPDVGSYWSGFFTNVESIKATGPLEVTVSLSAPDALVHQMFAVAGGVIESKAFVEKKGDQYGTPDGGLNCTGPFRLGEWTKGESISLERFDGYWDQDHAAKAASFDFSFIRDSNAATNALLSGEIDGTFGVAAESVDKLRKSGVGKLYYGANTATNNLTVANLDGPLKDVRIRRALSMALDREGFSEVATNGVSEPSRAVASRLTWGTGETEKLYADAWEDLPSADQDVAAAKALVEEAGAPAEPIVIAAVMSTPSAAVLANEVQAAGKRIGLEVEIKPIAADAYTALFGDPEARKGIDLFSNTWYADVADPLVIYLNWQSENFANYAGWKNADYDRLVQQAREESDPVTRAESVIELQRMATEEVLWIPVVQSPNSVFQGDGVTGAPATNAYLYYPWAAQVGAAGNDG
ncbi:ABC transporter substrate-binding protein [Nocardioides sp. LHG3406-4]|uniref:ABC transporter substrate-binding protein n=1 Tax=Nocardioides sp. LHG3406-4 TaxID=2804575 RepID=UPI003CEC464B